MLQSSSPSNAVPSNVVPSNVIPSNVIPSSTISSAPVKKLKATASNGKAKGKTPPVKQKQCDELDWKTPEHPIQEKQDFDMTKWLVENDLVIPFDDEFNYKELPNIFSQRKIQKKHLVNLKTDEDIREKKKKKRIGCVCMKCEIKRSFVTTSLKISNGMFIGTFMEAVNALKQEEALIGSMSPTSHISLRRSNGNVKSGEGAKMDESRNSEPGHILTQYKVITCEEYEMIEKLASKMEQMKLLLHSLRENLIHVEECKKKCAAEINQFTEELKHRIDEKRETLLMQLNQLQTQKTDEVKQQFERAQSAFNQMKQTQTEVDEWLNDGGIPVRERQERVQSKIEETLNYGADGASSAIPLTNPLMVVCFNPAVFKNVDEIGEIKIINGLSKPPELKVTEIGPFSVKVALLSFFFFFFFKTKHKVQIFFEWKCEENTFPELTEFAIEYQKSDPITVSRNTTPFGKNQYDWNVCAMMQKQYKCKLLDLTPNSHYSVRVKARSAELYQKYPFLNLWTDYAVTTFQTSLTWVFVVVAFVFNFSDENNLENPLKQEADDCIPSNMLKSPEKAALLRLVREKYSHGVTFSLLFDAKKHGFNARNFHDKCDNKGPTLIIIENELGHIFGAFTTVFFFLFTLIFIFIFFIHFKKKKKKIYL
ncbi:hypothetical protein RFI_04430 [Reticulomyxa filosa]|uniref:TLDc domain-containing protein n=1 Tax=Reticulomyxa filosa TaxID=46433 RepID=X6P3M1_RETFI|nr:hypothetical protein RFI_04430 [Reticulomyxa filosa]|eukprot:ETO32684.1 hypothetical protein RFI_04430 [Reticulomyxa filosa]